MIMPFRGRGRNMRPIHSIKHVVDLQNRIPGDAQQTFNLIEAVDAPVVTGATQVETGSTVNSIFLNVTSVAETTGAATIKNIYFMLYKNAGGNITQANIPSANQVGTSDFKTKVFHQEMIMTSDAADSIPQLMFKGVLRIPKHMRRMGINDAIAIQFFIPDAGNTIDTCIQCIYKEYR